MKRHYFFLEIITVFLMVGAFLGGYFLGQINKNTLPVATVDNPNIHTDVSIQDLEKPMHKAAIDPISQLEAMALVKQKYQSNHYLAVIAQDDTFYQIGCFTESYYDKKQNELHYTKKSAQYAVNKYTEEITQTDTN